jgi:hypothetical protein
VSFKHIFDDTGYSYIWSQQFFQNSDLLLALIRNRLHEQFTQEWHSLIQNSPKAINYRLCKDNFEFEKDKYESFVSLPVNSLAQYDIILNFTFGENKLIFNEMMRSALFYTNTLSWICIVLAH